MTLPNAFGLVFQVIPMTNIHCT